MATRRIVVCGRVSLLESTYIYETFREKSEKNKGRAGTAFMQPVFPLPPQTARPRTSHRAISGLEQQMT